MELAKKNKKLETKKLDASNSKTETFLLVQNNEDSSVVKLIEFLSITERFSF